MLSEALSPIKGESAAELVQLSFEIPGSQSLCSAVCVCYINFNQIIYMIKI